jgi:hypothetical protein
VTSAAAVMPLLHGDRTVVAHSINHLVDVYPQAVDSGVDIFAGTVNDMKKSAVVHLIHYSMWFQPNFYPHPNSMSVLGCRWLSPLSTPAMTTDVLN